jgi:DNA-binding response OmpR family regulator
MSKAVLLVEDSAVTALAIADALEDAGYEIIGPFASSRPAIDSLRRTRPDCAILDVSLTTGNSVELARELRALNVPFVVHTGWPAHAEIATEFRGAPWLEKPIRFDDLLTAVEALGTRRERHADSRKRVWG